MLKEIARYEDKDLRNTKWTCTNCIKDNGRGWREEHYTDSKGNKFVVETDFYDYDDMTGSPEIRNQILYQDVEEEMEVKGNDKLIGGNEMNVYMKLIQVQNELKAPKNQFNAFGKYNYRSCEDILEAVKPICLKYKAVVFVKDEIVMIGDRYYIKAISTFVDCESGDKIEADALARESADKKGMDSSQVTGSTSSYARKYSLNGLFCIDDTKDADFNNKHGKDGKQNKEELIENPDHVTTEMLISIATKKGVTEKRLQEKYKVSNIQYIKQDIKKQAYSELFKRKDKK